MGQQGEASVEEILDSIKKVIARDNLAWALEVRRQRESKGVSDDKDASDESDPALSNAEAECSGEHGAEGTARKILASKPKLRRRLRSVETDHDAPRPETPDEEPTHEDAQPEDVSLAAEMAEEIVIEEDETTILDLGADRFEAEIDEEQLQMESTAESDSSETGIAANSAAPRRNGSDGDNGLLSQAVRSAMQENLTALAMAAQPKPAPAPEAVAEGETSLEGLVREMLKPMLAEWLDANLPAMVEAIVREEIARISRDQG